MTAFAGLRGTGNFTTDERPKNFREMILFLDPNGAAPLYALTSKLASRKIDDPEFAWFEESLDVTRLVVSGTYNASTTTNTLTISAEGTTGQYGTALNLVPGDLLEVQKVITTGSHNNEILEVSSVTDAVTVVVKRGALGSTAAAINDTTVIHKIGNYFEEGVNSPNTFSNNPTKRYNYTQIFKTAFSLTRTAMQTRLRTGDVMQNERVRKMFEHAAAIEYAMIFGRRYEGTGGTNSKPIRATGGILDPNIGVSQTAFATTPTEDALLDAFEPLFQKTAPGVPQERIAFCGNGFLNAINKKIKNSASTRIMFDGTLSVYGMNMQKIIFPYGTIGFKTHPLFNRDPLYTKTCLTLAPSLLSWAEIQPTVEQKNIQANDADSKKNQWLTEGGLEIRGAANFHKLFSITDATQ